MVCHINIKLTGVRSYFPKFDWLFSLVHVILEQTEVIFVIFELFQKDEHIFLYSNCT